MFKNGICILCMTLLSVQTWAATPDVLIGHVEVTQTLQDDANAIPLVLGKPTVVRVFPKTASGTAIPGVSARLHASRSGVELPNSPIGPDNQAKPVDNVVDRLDPNDSLNFTLDPDWYAADVDVRIELVFPASHTDPLADNNVFKKHLAYQDRSGYRIGFLRVKYTNPAWVGQPEPRPRVTGQTACDYMRSLFPVDPTEVVYTEFTPGVITFSHGNAAGEIDGDLLITELNTLWSAAPAASRPDRLFAWTPENSFPSNGLSDPLWAGGQSHVSFGNDTDGRWRRTFAHETGHNTNAGGLFHTDRRLQNDEFGFDVLRVDPSNRIVMRKYPIGDADGILDLFDVMRGGELEAHAWITPPYYRDLFKHFEVAVADAGPPGANAIADAADSPPKPSPVPENAGNESREIQVVRGTVSRDGKGKFFPFYLIPAAADITTKVPNEGTHEIRFLGAENQLLKRIAWTPDFRSGDDEKALLDSRAFTWNIEPLQGVRKVELRRQDVLLDVLNVLRNSPKITELDKIEAADDDALAWRWNVSVPNNALDDSPQLTHQVFYSNDDGKTWRLVASGLQKTQWKADMSELPGGEKCLIQVRTTDGYNVDKHTSSPISVPVKKPKVVITAPGNGKNYLAGAGVLLTGQGVGHNDKVVDDSKLTWTSDVQGTLGTGKKFVARNLKAGAHKITLSIVDSNGNQSKSDPIEVTIEPRSPQ